MSPEKTKKLVEAFPLLYKDYTASKNKSLMPFGFAYSDGWFQLTWDLSEKLETLIKEFIDTYKDNSNYPRAFQCKEKFGMIRIYITGDYKNLICKAMHETIKEYEDKSAVTCEICGKAGILGVNSRGWWQTLCTICKSSSNYPT